MKANNSADSPYVKAQRALARRDERLKALIKQVGPCTLQPMPDVFPVLVRTVIAQQLSTKAATTISSRLEALLPEGLLPAAIERLRDEEIRGCGISGSKLKSIRDLCSRVRTGELPVERFSVMTDEEVRDALLQVFGIGPWSVDMYLIFCLGRLDVLPVGDLGLRLGVKDVFNLPEAPKPAQLIELAEPWRPYRTVATWYFWKSRGFVPQS